MPKFEVEVQMSAVSIIECLGSVKTAKPDAQMYFSILIALVGAMMFGQKQHMLLELQSRRWGEAHPTKHQSFLISHLAWTHGQ